AGEVQAEPKEAIASTAAPVSQPASGEYQFGTVTDGETGKPLADATVTVYYYRDAQDKEIQTLVRKTNAEGKYFFPLPSTINEDKHSWSVPRVTKEGYAPEEGRWLPIYFEDGIKDGSKQFDFKLYLSDPVTGRLVDEDGKPLANILIRGFRWNPENLWENNGLYPQFDMRSDESGRFKIDVPKNHSAAFWTLPDNLVIKQTLVKEKHGDLGDIVLEKGIRPTVKVLDPDGKPLAKTWVDLLRQDRVGIPMMTMSRRSALTDENGIALFLPVAADQYEIRISETPLTSHNQGEFPENMLWMRESTESLRQPVPGTFYIEYVDLTPESPAAVIQAQKSVKVNIHYLDGKDENRRHNTRISTRSSVEDRKWFVVPKSTSESDGYLGDGKFSFDVPVGLKDAELHVYSSGEDDVFICTVAGNKLLPSKDQSGCYSLGTIDKEMTVEVTCLKSPKLKVRVQDESGKPIQDYFAIADDAASDPPSKFEMLENALKITTEETWYEFKWSEIPQNIPWSNPLVRFMYDDYEKSNVQHSRVTFLPDREMKLYVFAQGYDPSEQTLPKMAEGEEREIVVTLKSKWKEIPQEPPKSQIIR
ncbi:MAG: carboxypeptidase regulatory-like domain-containing protein, partial [Planctomycetaceae bacterium]|nr:carboxypeptidase regulatory-like domain-containing protein [Planctomycetaceae bacterium]